MQNRLFQDKQGLLSKLMQNRDFDMQNRDFACKKGCVSSKTGCCFLRNIHPWYMETSIIHQGESC